MAQVKLLKSVFGKGLAAIALSMAGALSAQAETIIATDPDGIVAHFNALDMPARLTEDSYGDPLIDFRYEGEHFSLFFYDCEENTNCLSLQFYSGYQTTEPVSLETINAWNTEYRFVRAYLTDEGVSRIEMDVATSWHGIDGEDFDELIWLWLDSAATFETHIGW